MPSATARATTAIRAGLCRVGLHRWSENRGGIVVCRRDGCRRARTYGITGAIRRERFEERLYDRYQRFADGGDGE